MRFLWGAALVVVCALTPSLARAVDLEFNFRLRGEIDRRGGNGSVYFQVLFDESVAAEGVVTLTGSATSSTGLLSGINPTDSFLINNGLVVNESFTVPVSLDLDQDAVFDVVFGATSSGHDIDFRSGVQNAASVFGEGSGLQGLLLESVTLAGGGSLVSGGYELLFDEAATELSAEATFGGEMGTVDQQTGPLPSILASADGASLAGVAATFDPAVGPVILWSAFPDISGSDLDIAEASLRAVRETVDEMEVAMPNIRLIEYVPEPADYNANGLIDIADYQLWRNTFGDEVAPGDGADGNGDGVVDIADYTVWRDAFGTIEAPAAALAAAPEPGALTLLLTGVLLTVAMRRL